MMSCKASCAPFVSTKPGYGRPRAFRTVQCAAYMPAEPQEVTKMISCCILQCASQHDTPEHF